MIAVVIEQASHMVVWFQIMSQSGFQYIPLDALQEAFAPRRKS